MDGVVVGAPQELALFGFLFLGGAFVEAEFGVVNDHLTLNLFLRASLELSSFLLSALRAEAACQKRERTSIA